MAEQTLKEKTSKGLFWGGMSSFLQQLISALFGIYLARVLSPGDYGLVGMLTIFTMIAQILQEAGFSSALINRKVICHEDYNAVFWFSMIVSVLCYVVLFFCAPLIARFFHHAELVKLARWTFLGFILSGLMVSPSALLNKQLKIREKAITNIAAIIVSGFLGVFFAFKGYGYWALTIQSLVFSMLRVIGFWYYSKWRPSLSIVFSPIKEMFSYSVRLLITSLVGVVNSNLVTIVIGRRYAADRVGYYTQANKWFTVGNMVLIEMVGSVSQPVLAEVLSDTDRQLRVFRKLIRFAAFISFPAMLGLGFITPEFISLVLTEKWADSIPLMQILCIAGAFTPVMDVMVFLLLSRGRSDIHMWANIARFIAVLGAVILAYPFGIKVMVLGVTIVNTLWLFIWHFFVRKEIGYTYMALLKDLSPCFIISIISIILTFVITKSFFSGWALLAAKIIITAFLYFSILLLSGSPTFKECTEYIRTKFNKEM